MRADLIAGNTDQQNFGANVVGSLNSIRSKGHSGSSGVANSIVGVANTVENANGTLVYGAGAKAINAFGVAFGQGAAHISKDLKRWKMPKWVQLSGKQTEKSLLQTIST